MFSCTVPASEFRAFRRRILRNGGAIVLSSLCGGNAYAVTYVAKVGA